jgi:hypothetical protein
MSRGTQINHVEVSLHSEHYIHVWFIGSIDLLNVEFIHLKVKGDVLVCMHLIQPKRRVHLVEGPHITSNILNTYRLISGKTALNYKFFSVNMAKRLESNNVLKPFNKGEVPDRPLWIAVPVTRRDVTDYPDGHACLTCFD